MRAIRYRVRGRVQGVGFRWYALRAARDAGLSGWVRNLPDGTVEAVAAGEDAALARFRAALESGPPASSVDSVEESEAGGEELLAGRFQVV
jgi:acylphosphatase